MLICGLTGGKVRYTWWIQQQKKNAYVTEIGVRFHFDILKNVIFQNCCNAHFFSDSHRGSMAIFFIPHIEISTYFVLNNPINEMFVLILPLSIAKRERERGAWRGMRIAVCKQLLVHKSSLLKNRKSTPMLFRQQMVQLLPSVSKFMRSV